MTRSTRASARFNTAGASDSGLHRTVNEDRCHVDPSRGIFIVVDGVGGQAAGGKAADIALETLTAAIARPAGTAEHRVRAAVIAANNAIHSTAARRAEWKGMACVLTVVVIEDERAIVGHVGDTRLYKLRAGIIQKVTRDHSPVGEREDQGELSEGDAMRHPRRHEVYRDVGSERHGANDEGFVDLYEIPFESDAALVLCSDGLTDLVESAVINDVATSLAGRPDAVVERLIEAANDAGGKDNVTVVYVEGEQFAESVRQQSIAAGEITRRQRTLATVDGALPRAQSVAGERRPATSRRRAAVAGVLTFVAAAAIVTTYPYWSVHLRGAVALPPSSTPTIVVQPTESIAAALERAKPGSQVVVEPGEYRDQLVLRSGVRVVSRVPRAATLRLPGAASDREAAVVAAGVSGAALVGFRIVGDAATPLGIGVLVRDAELAVMDVEISGAAEAAVEVREQAYINLVGSTIRDNPGAALTIRTPASRIAHNQFAQNGTSSRVPAAIVLDRATHALFSANIFHGPGGQRVAGATEEWRTRLLQDNWFLDATEPNLRPGATHRDGRGR